MGNPASIPVSMPVSRGERLALVLLLLPVLAGCFSRTATDRCNEFREYQASTSVAPFQSPEGLEQPPPPQRFAIPAASGTGDQPVPGCLDRPPDFFGRPIGSLAEPPRPGSGAAPAAAPE